MKKQQWGLKRLFTETVDLWDNIYVKTRDHQAPLDFFCPGIKWFVLFMADVAGICNGFGYSFRGGM